MCGLVLLGVLPALHSGSQQADLLQKASEPDRRGGHPAILHHAASGQHVQGGEASRLWQQLLGQSGPGAAGSSSLAHPLRDAAGSPFVGPADSWPDSATLHTGVWAAPPFSLRGYCSVFTFAVPD